MHDDPFDLARFRSAQDAGGTFDAALAELGRGRKTSHWMWFVFPQVAGLGRSETAVRYAVSGPEEARAYLADPVLGPRLERAAAAAADAPASDAEALLGAIDAQKLRSSMTLFQRTDPSRAAFRRVLDRWFGGEEDPATVALL